jgi:hypothetical protein
MSRLMKAIAFALTVIASGCVLCVAFYCWANYCLAFPKYGVVEGIITPIAIIAALAVLVNIGYGLFDDEAQS